MMNNDGLTISVNTDGNFQTGMQQNAAASNQFSSALQQLQSAMAQLSGAALQVNGALAQFGAGMNQASAAATQAGAAMTSGGGGLLAVFDQVSNSVAKAAGSVANFGGGLIEAVNPLNLFHSQVMRLVEVMGLWRIFEEGSKIVRELVDNITQLPIAMQRTEVAWQYTYGMGPNVNPTGDTGIAKGIAQQLASWSAQYSYNIPFTRQDMLQGITNLSMANLSPTGVQEYIPLMADLAATAGNGFGGGPVTLSRASYAIQGALMGYNRMLQYDLHIRPEQLQQYGYDANNPATLLPALQKFGIATKRVQYARVDPKTGQPLVDTDINSDSFGQPLKGAAVDPTKYSAKEWADMIANHQVQDVGGAYVMAHTTWTGAYSSFQDRLQNFALDVGGYPAFNSPDGTKAGKMRQGSPIDVAMQGLTALTAWWDKNQTKFDALGAFLSKTLAAGMSDAARGVLAFGQGLRDSGITGAVGHAFMDFANFLKSSDMQAKVQEIAKSLGSGLGTELQHLGGDISDVTGAFDALRKDFGDQNMQTALGALKTFTKEALTLFDELVKGITDAVKVIGDQFAALAALKRGDWTSFQKYEQQSATDLGSLHIDIVDAYGDKTDEAKKHVAQSSSVANTKAGKAAAAKDPSLKGWVATLEPMKTLKHGGRAGDQTGPEPVSADQMQTVIDSYSGLFNTLVGQIFGNGLGAAAKATNPVEWVYHTMLSIFGGGGSGSAPAIPPSGGPGGKPAGGGLMGMFNDLGTAFGNLHTTTKPLNDELTALHGNVQTLNAQVAQLNITLGNVNGGGGSGSRSSSGKGANAPFGTRGTSIFG